MQGRVDFIDGLRTLSILSVVAFHASVPHFGGGYLGVDVFMVISGYLIIGQLARADDFSFLNFWAARALRILPSLFVVVLATLLVGRGLTPLETTHYATSAAATLALVPNIYFMSHSGYFDVPALREPFLHMWSLGVEEQFYLAAPVLVFLLVAAGKRMRASVSIPLCLGVIALVSFIFFVKLPAITAFYAMPTRIWEFALGGIVGTRKWNSAAVRPVLREAVAAGCLLLILGSVVLVTPNVRFPGSVVLLPTLSCAGLLASSGTRVHRLLSLKPCVYIGLISYAWYLWHWPIFVLIRAYNFGESRFWLELFGQFLGGGLLAWLSYSFIERPLREFRHRPAFKEMSGRFLASAVTCSVAGVVLCISYGRAAEARLDGPEFAAYRSAKANEVFPCADTRLCEFGAPGKAIVIWGDSLAGSLAAGAVGNGVAAKNRIIMISMPSCPPVLDVDISNGGRPPTADCSKHNAQTLQYLRDHAAAIAKVILIANWPEYGVPGGQTVAVDAASRETSAYATLLTQRLAQTLAALSQFDVTLIGSVPTWYFPAPECAVQVNLRGADPARCGLSQAEFQDQRAQAEAILKQTSGGFTNVSYVDPAHLFCDEQRCSPIRGGDILYSDTTHFTPAVARGLLAELGF